MAGSMRQRGNDSWQLRVHAGRDPATGRKRYVERTFHGTNRDASKALAAIVAEVDQRPVGLHGKGTVAPLCHEWLAHATPSFSPKTVETTRMYIEDPIIPALGSTQVAKLTPTDLDRFYRQLLEVGRSRGPYAPATIRRVHGIIRRALTQGVRWGWITHNPAIDASPPRVPMKELKPPDPGQVVQLFRLAQESDPELAAFVMLAASSGARRGELLALRWNDVDLDQAKLSIERGSCESLMNSSSRAQKRIRVVGFLSTPGRSPRCRSTIRERSSEPTKPAPPSSPKVSCSAIQSTARHPGTPTRRREPSGKSVSRRGSQAFGSTISGTT